MAKLFPNGTLRGVIFKDLEEALVLLERDHPEFFLCFRCKRFCLVNAGSIGEHIKSDMADGLGVLARWHQASHCAPIKNVSYTQQYLLRPVRGDTWDFNGRGPEINFSAAHSALRRATTGEKYGIPLDVFEHDFFVAKEIDLISPGRIHNHFPLSRLDRQVKYGAATEDFIEIKALQHDGTSPKSTEHMSLLDARLATFPEAGNFDLWRFSHKYRAKIINKELYVAAFHTITGPKITRHQLVQLLHKLRFTVCRHITLEQTDVSLQTGSWQPHGSLTLESRSSVLDPSRCAGSYGSCVQCHSDFFFHTKALPGCTGWWCYDQWRVELSTYHRLGPCDTLHDPVWRIMASNGERPRIRNGWGDIMFTWNRAV
jgi:hypothetical protein